jgi:hypothetical protein
MISLLEDYADVLHNEDKGDSTNYYMAADTISADEWSGFDNVYHVHCPKVFLNESVRDVRIYISTSPLALISITLRF